MRLRTTVTVAALAALLLAGCGGAPPVAAPRPPAPAVPAVPTAAIPADPNDPLLADLEERTFHWFWDLADPATGLIPDRAPTPSFSSVAAVGFGLTAYTIGAERGWVTREAARDRVRHVLQFLLDAPQGPQPKGMTSYHGFLYHFLDMKTGRRFEKVELSTIDTTLLMAGVLACQSYFDRADPAEAEVRDLAEKLYSRVDWTWARVRPPAVSHGWTPEEGFISWDWRGLNEAMILYVLALGSPTHPVDPAAWEEWTRTYQWHTGYFGQDYVTFGPLFGHQYSQCWVDFNGIQDAYMRAKGIDYFENSRRATLSQRTYAIENPAGWKGYGADVWGLTASDGPLDVTLKIGGRDRTFHTYWARGVSPQELLDDGTIAPTAAAASLPFAPEVVLPALREMRRRFGEPLYGRFGFVDAFNPTFDVDVKPQHGHVVKGLGWFDYDQLGIDQGPIVIMIENYRSGLVWKTMRKNPHVVRGLKRAGFTGGWLEEAP
ncbi:MAG TPA: glucoamylase family protein [Thermoanaerobaculia bacterium]|nr:glucoamylase family protein [Thermoanaerobaculia bacterium]